MVIVQIILRTHPCASAVIRSFDFGPCQICTDFAAVDKDGDIERDDALQITATAMWVASMRHLAFPVDIHNWTRSSAMRVMKYVGKGFDVAVPGIYRRQHRKINRSRISIEDGESDDDYNRGLPYMFELEARVDDLRGISTDLSVLPSVEDVRRLVERAPVSDYLDEHYESNICVRFVKQVLSIITRGSGHNWTWRKYVDNMAQENHENEHNVLFPADSEWHRLCKA